MPHDRTVLDLRATYKVPRDTDRDEIAAMTGSIMAGLEGLEVEDPSVSLDTPRRGQRKIEIEVTVNCDDPSQAFGFAVEAIRTAVGHALAANVEVLEQAAASRFQEDPQWVAKTLLAS